MAIGGTILPNVASLLGPVKGLDGVDYTVEATRKAAAAGAVVSREQARLIGCTILQNDASTAKVPP